MSDPEILRRWGLIPDSNDAEALVRPVEIDQAFESWQITEQLRWRDYGGTIRLEQAWMSADNRYDWRVVPTVIG